MTEYGICGESDYTMITFADLFDLRYARIFKAEIVSIDQINNCAQITIDEACPELAEKDLSAVPFFYHCEDSTGTVEDLANGYKAFTVLDEVFVLWIPINGAVEERFFIIGHANIRTNKRCSITEYLVVEMGSPAYITIFDTAAGDKMNISAFANLDEESPVKPSSLPCLLTETVEDWIDYNFRASISACDIPSEGSVRMPLKYPSESWTDTYVAGPNDGGVSYCGEIHTAQSNYSVDRKAVQTLAYQHSNLVRDSYYTHSYTDVREISSGSSYDWWKILDGVAGDFNYYAISEVTIDYSFSHYNASSYADGYEDDGIAVSTFNLYIKIDTDEAILLRTYSESADMHRRWSATINGIVESGSGYLVGEFFRPAVVGKWAGLTAFGEVGTYFVTGISFSYTKWTAGADSAFIYSLGSMHIDDRCTQITMGMYFNTPPDPPAVTQPVLAPLSSVSIIAEIEDLDLSAPVSTKFLFKNRNINKSDNLNDVVEELAMLVLDENGWIASTQAGPTRAVAMIKKPSVGV